MPPFIPNFRYERIPGHDGVAINAAVGGSGVPVVLLHGFPQTHLMWRHVAVDLAVTNTVIVPDLRAYGDSDRPGATTPGMYSKRTMASDVVEIASALGHERFARWGTIAECSWRFAQGSTNLTRSVTSESSTCFQPSTCGTCFTASMRPWPGTSTSWRSQRAFRSG